MKSGVPEGGGTGRGPGGGSRGGSGGGGPGGSGGGPADRREEGRSSDDFRGVRRDGFGSPNQARPERLVAVQMAGG